MYPILADFESFTLHTYGLMCAIGFLVLGVTMITLGQRSGLKAVHLMDTLLIGSLAGLVGARVVFCLQNPEHFEGFRDILNLQRGGLVFYGAVLVGLPATVGVMRFRKLPVFDTLDIVAVGGPFAHAIARLGCFAAGCCYGLPSDATWAVTYGHEDAVAQTGISMHPVQVYESLSLVGIGLLSVFVFKKRQWKGQVMLTYMSLYALARFSLEGFRGDVERGLFFEPLFGDWLSFSQGISLCLLAVAVGVFYFGARRVGGINP